MLHTTISPREAKIHFDDFLNGQPVRASSDAKLELERSSSGYVLRHYPNGAPNGGENSSGHYRTNEMHFDLDGRFQRASSYITKEQQGIAEKFAGTEEQGPTRLAAYELAGRLV